MFIVIFLLGFLPLLLVGWLAVSALQGPARVLTRPASLVYGAILGPTIVMEVVFLLNAGNLMRLNLWAYLAALGLLLIPLGILEYRRRKQSSRPLLPPHLLPSLRLTIPKNKAVPVALLIVALWLLLKLAAGFTILMSDPAYNDDVFNNWSYRAKVLHHEEMLVINRENPGVTAYPPTFPMIKVWFALVNGAWNDRLVVLTSPLWYLLALALVWCTLRRTMDRRWSLIGTYMLASLPLFLIHGFTPYADLFLSLHIAAALLPLTHALLSPEESDRVAWLKLSALGTALLPMTKNEALLMHLPPILLIAAGVVAWSILRGNLSRRTASSVGAAYAALVLAVLVPWLLYKWTNGLTFGNAKSIGGIDVVWQENVLKSLFITYVLEANFLLLPGILFPLLVIRYRTAFLSPLLPLTSFLLVTLLGAIGIFLFTGLSAEALRQTGSARAIVQLLPVMTVLATMLMRDVWKKMHHA